MSEERPITKAQLMKEIDDTWSKLNAALDRLTETQMTGIRDAEGWAVKDHLTHLAAWERSVVFLLQGKPRHEGLGVDEKLWQEKLDQEKLHQEGDDDKKINAAIQSSHEDLTAAEARDMLQAVHARMLDLLQPLSNEDLLRPYSYYLPDEQRDQDDSPVFFRVYGNTAQHFAEHQEWIETLVSGTAEGG